MRGFRHGPHAFLLAVLMVAACGGGHGSSKYFAFSKAQARGAVIAQADRKPAHPVKAELIDGGEWSLKSSAGHVTVLSYWASWCSPCQVEVPNLVTMSQESVNREVVFVGVDAQDEKSSAAAFIQHHEVNYPVVFDPTGQTAVELGRIHVPGLPFSVVLDRRGLVAAVYVGSLQPADLQPVLNRLNGEPSH